MTGKDPESERKTAPKEPETHQLIRGLFPFAGDAIGANQHRSEKLPELPESEEPHPVTNNSRFELIGPN